MQTSDLAQTGSGTLAQVEEIVRDVTGEDTLVLTPETRPADVEGWDSLANVSIVFCLEEAFGVDDLLLAGFETVGDLVALIDRRLEA
ncbi:MAG: acyl carrier protein [Solirubrobacteraceae bacterium]